MDTGTHLALSYYREIAVLSKEHGVFLVQHRETDKVYVKKVIQVYDLSVYRQLMEQPVRNTPRIHELHESGNMLYLIEEYIQGDSLETLLEQRGPFTSDEVCRIICDLCDILCELHSRKPAIIHRDIKPSNIILTNSNEVILLDFNAARNYKASKSEDTRLLGTRGYAAPEQYGFGESSERTDIYAAGALMKALLTGCDEKDDDLPDDLARIIRTCMKMDPSGRYQSAAELKSALLACEGTGEQVKSICVPAKGSSEADTGNGSFRSFFPPGFRSGRPLFMIPMGFLYLVIAAMWITMEMKNRPQEYQLFERSCFCIALFLCIFFSGNYLGMQDKLKVSGIKRLWLRIIVIIMVNVLIMLAAVIIAVIVESILG